MPRYQRFDGDELGGLSWANDIPFPEINLLIYNEIYYVEQWLRRILYSALLFTHGQGWMDEIPIQLKTELNKRRGNVKGKIMLDCENSSNGIWLLTLEELNQLITHESLWPVLKGFISLSRTELREKIDLLREIRNLIGHNRATTKNTWLILSGVLEVLNAGIKQFKSELDSEKRLVATLETKERLIDQRSKAIFEYCETKKVRCEREVRIFETDYFYRLFSSPIDEQSKANRQHVNVSRLLENFKDLETGILSFGLFFFGGFIDLNWPKNIAHETHFQIIDRFYEALPELWFDIDYSEQSPKYICDPKIWIYGSGKEFWDNVEQSRSKE